MSTPPTREKNRRELLTKISELGRKISTQTVFLHQAIAQSVGLNATDTKCIDLILRGPADSVTAGWLSEMTGLTTGAITHILDRLEKRQLIERVRDTLDRRKVFIRVRTEGIEPLLPKYDAIGKSFLSLAERYGDDELRLICDYLEKTSEVSERELARMIAANRAAVVASEVVTSTEASGLMDTMRVCANRAVVSIGSSRRERGRKSLHRRTNDPRRSIGPGSWVGCSTILTSSVRGGGRCRNLNAVSLRVMVTRRSLGFRAACG